MIGIERTTNNLCVPGTVATAAQYVREGANNPCVPHAVAIALQYVRERVNNLCVPGTIAALAQYDGKRANSKNLYIPRTIAALAQYDEERANSEQYLCSTCCSCLRQLRPISHLEGARFHSGHPSLGSDVERCLSHAVNISRLLNVRFTSLRMMDVGEVPLCQGDTVL